MANKIDLAEQQLVGFRHAKDGYSLISLIEAMGLTKKEWTTMQKTHDLSNLDKTDITEINEHFK